MNKQGLNKQVAILLTVGSIIVVYLFLLVAIPVLENIVGVCGSCNSSETVNITAIEAITANWTAIGPALRDRPFREIYKAPLILYLIPGLVGIAVIAVILSQKKEAK